MRCQYAVGNGVVTDGLNCFYKNGAILIEDDRISKICDTSEIKNSNLTFFDVKGRLILPSFVNFHHHLYSTLSLGLNTSFENENFREHLENHVWKFDAILDEESIYYSVLLGLIDSIKHGITVVFDHHASMNCAGNSLTLIRDAFNAAGIKGVLCFETSDRGGPEGVKKQFDENISLWEKCSENDNVLSAFGLHANFTLSESTLENVAVKKPVEMPIHIQCGESKLDLDFCINLGYKGVIDRLNKFGLIDNHSIVAHAIHLSDRDYEILADLRPIVVSNPESNATNHVGRINTNRLSNYVLGTDGMGNDILQTLRIQYLLHNEATHVFENLTNIFFKNTQEAVSAYFPSSGCFKENMKADIAILDYVPVTPISKNNLIAHLLFGARGGNVYMTISDGKILYKDGKINIFNEHRVLSEVQEIAEVLQKRFYSA